MGNHSGFRSPPWALCWGDVDFRGWVPHTAGAFGAQSSDFKSPLVYLLALNLPRKLEPKLKPEKAPNPKPKSECPGPLEIPERRHACSSSYPVLASSLQAHALLPLIAQTD